MSKKTLRLWSVLLSVFLVVSMIPTMVFAGNEDPIEIIAQPEDITAQIGEEATMSVVAENVASYQWQRSADGENWSNIGATNSNYRDVKTDTLTIKVNKNTITYVYRCTLKNSTGSVSTDSARVNLQQQLEITTQPSDISGTNGEQKTMSVVANNATSYQWQRSSDGESWANIGSTNVNYSNAKTSTLTIKISKTTAGFVYRCVATNSDGSVNSDSASVTLTVPLTITAQPVNVEGLVGEEKTMSVVAQNATSYQWQRSSDGQTWSNVSTTNVNYGDAKTDTLIIKINKTTVAYVYRCIVKNSTSSATSDPASVTITEPAQVLEITSQPSDVSGEVGEEKAMTVAANNATSYQWQRSADGQTWSNISATNTNYRDVKTSTLTVKINKTTVAYVYRCVVKNAESSVNSESVSVFIAEPALPLEIMEQPENIFGEAGEEKTMRVVANNATSYQWQRSADGENWSNISATNKNYADAKTDTLTVKINNTTKAYVYRCVVKNDDGESLASESAQVMTGVTGTFDANGGYFSSGTAGQFYTQTENMTSGSHINEYMNPVRERYIFEDWCLDKDCTKIVDIWSFIVTEDVTFYAKWTKVESVEVIFDGNGGYFQGDSNITVYEASVVKDRYISTAMLCEKPERDGYAFAGWYFDSEFESRAPLNFLVNETIVLYAKWSEAVNVTWNGNGGYFIEDTSCPTYVTSAAKGEALGCSGYTFLRDDYVMDGWYLDPECTVSVDTWDYVVTGDVTLYVKWQEAASVTWNANGGYIWPEGEEPSPTITVQVRIGYSVDRSTAPDREGYAFDGWCLDAEGTERVNPFEYIVTENVTFYAKWTDAIYVTLDANGGYFSGDPDCQTYTIAAYKDEYLTYYFGADPCKPGYVFCGWYSDPQFTDRVYLSSYYVTETVTFYAKWETPTYANWDCNGGSLYVDGKQYASYPEALQNNQYINTHYWNPQKKGFVFCGWYLDKDCTEQPDYYYYLTEDVTFYAKWADAVYVTWEANGGYVNSNSTYTQMLPKDEYLNYYQYAYREDYFFDGWYLDAECTQPLTDWWSYVVTENVTFYAKWDKGCKITWNANGGYFWGDPATVTYIQSVATNEVLIDNVPWSERAGYVFAGWYYDPECTEEAQVEGYVVNKDVTFYAKWDKGCEITWDCCGGYYVVVGEVVSTWKEPVSRNTLLGGYIVPSRDGCVLEGWYLDSDYEERVIFGEYVVTQDVTFYAKWAEAIYVTWDANGGTIWGEPTYIDSVLQNTNLIACSCPTPERNGYAFDGWCLDEDCTELVDRYDYVVNENVTFYAKWVEAVYITWDFNGGYVWPSEFTYLYSETTPIAKNSMMDNNYFYYTPQRDGYVFAGWCLDAEGTENVDLYNYYFDSDVTFYAKWRDTNERVNVTWNANGGCFWGNTDNPTYTEQVEPYTALYDCSQNVSRAGYVFDGWYLDADCTEYADITNYWTTEDVTFYANWAEAYTVTWNGNGGVFQKGDESFLTNTTLVRKNQQIDSYPDPYPTRTGYAFEGWYLDANCTEKVDTWRYRVDADVTLYANWIEAVSVTWNAVGGCLWGDTENPVSIYTESCGKNQQVAWYASNPVKDGYVFDGWYLDSEYEESVDVYNYIATEDVTFYAKWAEAVNITWDANGGYFYGVPDLTIYLDLVRKGTDLDGWYKVPERDGYIFEGWYYDVDGIDHADFYLETIYAVEDLTLYAKWSRDTQTYVTSITCTEPLSLLELVDGYYGADDSFFYSYKHSESYGDVLNAYGFQLTINYSDGTSFTGCCDEINALGYGGVYFSDDQLDVRWTVDGENYITVSYRGVQSQIPVTIIPNTVTGISCASSIRISEYTNGEYYWYNGDPFFKYYTSQRTWVDYNNLKFYDDFYNQDLIYTVEFSDRDPVVGNAATIHELTGLCLTISDDDQWTEHWYTGNTYYITANLAGYSTSIPVSIVQKEVESITCPTPLVLVENVDGHEESYWGGEYFRYDYKHRESYGDVLNEYSFKLKINYTDGTSFTGYCDEINALGFGGVYFSDDQEYNHWTVEGENYLTVSYRGVQSQIPVKISRNTVTSITCANTIEIVENTKGRVEWYNGEPFFKYWASGRYWETDSKYVDTFSNVNLIYTVEFSDREPLVGDAGTLYRQTGFSLGISGDDQWTEHWVAGETYYITIEFAGQTTTVPVTIIPHGVSSITCNGTLRLNENTEGYYTSDGYFRYEYYYSTMDANIDAYSTVIGSDTTFTISYSDGRDDLTGTCYDSFELTHISFEFSGDNQSRDPWLPGRTYTVEYIYCGVVGTMDVYIVPSASDLQVSSITCSKPLELLENDEGTPVMFWNEETSEGYGYFHYRYAHRESYGDVLNAYGFLLTINYTDGSNFTGYCDQINALGYGGVYFSDDQDTCHWEVGGENYITVSYRGVQSQIPVTIIPNNVMSISCSECIHILENTNGEVQSYNGDPFFMYYTADPHWVNYDEGTHYDDFYGQNLIYTVEFTDRDRVVGTAAELYAETGLCLTISDDNQWTNHWELGHVYYVTASFSGHRIRIPVAIVAASSVTITWDGNGGYLPEYDDSQVYSETVSGGHILSVPEPFRSGFAFDGWYLDENCWERVYFDNYIAVTDITFYAGWTDPRYVTWNANGGYMERNQLESYTRNERRGDCIFDDELCYRDGYYFDGWYFDQECTQKAYFPYCPDQDVTLYAKWRPQDL